MKEQQSMGDQLLKLVASGALQQPASQRPPKPLRKLRAKALVIQDIPEPQGDVLALQPQLPNERPIVEETAPGLPTTAEKLSAAIERATKRFRALNSEHAQADGRQHLEQLNKTATKLHSMVTAALKGQRKPEATAAREAAVWLANSGRSLLDAHMQQDLESQDVMQVRAGARSRLEAISQYLEGQVHEVDATRLEDLPAAYFSKYRRYGARLPSATSMTQKGHRFTTIKAPIIALFSKIVTAQQLEAAGFDVSDDGGYITFLEQEVWCINTAALRESAWEGDEAGYVEKLKAQYKQRTGKVAEFMGLESKQRIGHPNAKGISFYWVLSRNEARGLTSATGAAVLQEWGFAF